MPGPTAPASPLAIFNEALDLRSPSERAAYLERACAGDPALRARVEALLAVHDRAGDFLEAPAVAPMLAAFPGGSAASVGAVIGRYRLIEPIGEGGMGVVFVVEQSEPVRREVALKVIKPGMDSRQVLARFEAERQALALMDHPNIARIFDAGVTESGRPYFVMELVRGLPIGEYCDRERLPIRERLGLFVQVCRAVQHAHQKGIIHRDLKPSNVLVTLHDGTPVPKVIDFGVAKATGGDPTGKTITTAFAHLVGTPLYMSPEQVELSGIDIDTRSDIYSLGVLLYELLTGTTPFDAEALRRAAFDEMRRIIREEEPPTPSARLSSLGAAPSTVRCAAPRHLNRSVRGELDWIAMKCLEKDRARRYETAGDLASDVTRYLTDQPVLACPPAASYRFRKFARRNRASLATAALVAVALLLGIAVSLRQAVRATRAEALAASRRDLAEASAAEAVRQRDEARRQRSAVVAREETLRRYLYAADMKLAWQAWSHAWSQDDPDQARRLLARHEPDAGQDDLRSFAWYYLKGLWGRTPRPPLVGHRGKVYHVAISPDGRTLASASEDGTAKLWDLATSRLRHTLTHGGEVNCVAFAPDGQELATAGDDRTVRFWDPADGRERPALALKGFGMPVRRVDYSADGTLLVAGELSERLDVTAATLWDVSSRRRRVRMEGHFPLALSPDSKTLATTNVDKAVRLWDAASGRERALLRGHDEDVLAGTFSPDGGTLATGGHDGTVRLWDLEGMPVGLHRLRGPAYTVAYSPNGRLLAAGGGDHAVCLWETSSGRQMTTFGGHVQIVRAVRFTPDGGTLATVSDDRTVKLWDLTATSLAPQPPVQPDPITALSFSGDGELLATSIGQKRGMLWAVRTGEARAVTPHRPDREVTGAAFSPVGRVLAVTGSDRSVSLVDPITGNELMAVAGPGVSNGVLAFSPDGGILVGGCHDGVVRVWETRTGKELHALPETGRIPSAQSIAFSPDGRTLALQGDGVVTCWDLATGSPRDLWTRSLRRGVNCLAYSPDGRMLATGDDRRERITLWERSTGRERANLSGDGGAILSLAFSPDGRTLASGGNRGELKLWDVATAQEIISLVGHIGPVICAAFSPDGNTLATAGTTFDGRRGELRFWRAERPSRRPSKPNGNGEAYRAPPDSGPPFPGH